MNDSMHTTMYGLLMQIALRSRHDFARIAEKEYGLTGMQLYTLYMLQPDTSLSMQVITCQMGCDASNVTGIVDRLVTQGYIERKEDPVDRRSKVLNLTRKGIALRRVIMEDLLTTTPATLQSLTEGEVKRLHVLLAKALLPSAKK